MNPLKITYINAVCVSSVDGFLKRKFHRTHVFDWFILYKRWSDGVQTHTFIENRDTGKFKHDGFSISNVNIDPKHGIQQKNGGTEHQKKRYYTKCWKTNVLRLISEPI